MSDQVGMQLGAYRLYEKIGGGGFATVYVARDTRTNELVAIKVLHPHLSQDAQFIARFRREAETLQKIPPHPNIVGLREFGQQAGTYYLVMEYLQGKDVAQILAERKRLPVDEALAIAAQIAQALDVAHQHGLVHRDIKPANIKLMPQGVVKVMDFGIARATEGTQLTQSGTFVGTPDYIAPEIWKGKPADIRADIYALGALLYEMLTGSAPFHSDTPAAVMRRHLMEQPRSVRAMRADVPASVDAVIAKMMAKDPAARYQTPAQVAVVLQSAVRSDAPTMLAQRPIPPQQLRQNTLSRMLPVGIGAVAGIVILVLVAVILVMPQSGAKNSAQIAQQTQTSIALVPTQPPTVILVPTATRVVSTPIAVATFPRELGSTPLAPVIPTSMYTPSAMALPSATLARITPTISPPSVQPTTPISVGLHCDNPNARITSPAMNATIRGIVSIMGVANVDDFLYYKVQFMPESSWGTEQWGILYQGKTPLAQVGKLMDWYTNTVAPGAYWLRLIVADRTGNYPEPCLLRVVVER